LYFDGEVLEESGLSTADSVKPSEALLEFQVPCNYLECILAPEDVMRFHTDQVANVKYLESTFNLYPAAFGESRFDRMLTHKQLAVDHVP
jgi:hypothetical protein